VRNRRTRTFRQIAVGLVIALLSAIGTLAAAPSAEAQLVQISWIEECPEAQVFTDVPDDVYYAEAVAWAYCNGITLGTSATTFSPNANVTRGQMATFLHRYSLNEKQYAPNHFLDVPDNAYYTDPIRWMIEENAARGNIFSPDSSAPRWVMALYIWRLAGEPTPVEPNPFGDVSNPLYTEAVTWLAQVDGTNGTGDGSTFSPDARLTRADTVMFLFQLASEEVWVDITPPGNNECASALDPFGDDTFICRDDSIAAESKYFNRYF